MLIEKEVCTKQRWENKERRMAVGAYYATEDTKQPEI